MIPCFASPPTLPRAPSSPDLRRKLLSLGRARGWIACCENENAPAALSNTCLSPADENLTCSSPLKKGQEAFSPTRRARLPQMLRAAFTSGTLPAVAPLPSLGNETGVDELAGLLIRSLDLSPSQMPIQAEPTRTQIPKFIDERDFQDDEKNLEFGSTESELKGEAIWIGKDSFAKNREAIALRLLRYFDKNVLCDRLGSSVNLRWNNRLLRTAGLTCMKRRESTGDRTAVIELSTKVLDEPERLYNTLAHELCHAAAWILDNCARPPHGREFKAWATVFHSWDHNLVIKTCHDYNIRYRFVYVCTACSYEYGRHSKSIDVTKTVCGRCKNSLKLSQRETSRSP